MMRAMKTFIRFAVLVIAIWAMTISSAQAAKKFVTIAGGASGGTYIVVATGMAKILSKYVPGMRANAEVTGGGFGNTRLIGTKRADFGLTTRTLPTLRCREAGDSSQEKNTSSAL